MKFSGHAPAEIATRTGYKLGTVRGILSDALCKAYIQSLSDVADVEIVNIRKRLINMNNLALDRVQEILERKTDIPWPVVATMVKDNLDRSGYAPVQRNINMTMELTPEDIAGIKERARSAGATIDVDYTEENVS